MQMIWPYKPFKVERDHPHCPQCTLEAEDLKILSHAVVLFIKRSAELNEEGLMTLIKYLEMTGKRVGLVLPPRKEVEKTSIIASYVIGRASSLKTWSEQHPSESAVLIHKGTVQQVLKEQFDLNVKDMDIVENSLMEYVQEGQKKYFADELDELPLEERLEDLKQRISYTVSNMFHMYHFPYSSLEPETVKRALKQLWYGFSEPLSEYLINTEGWVEETSLDRLFGEYVLKSKLSIVLSECHTLSQAYLEGDLRAGYYLLWLIRRIGGCSYTLPKKENFNFITVSKILCTECRAFKMESPQRFLQAMIEGNVYYQILKGNGGSSVFVECALRALCQEQWPNRDKFLIELLKRLSSNSKIKVAEGLQQRPIGFHLLAAMRAESYTESLPHFYALQSLSESFESSNMSCIFGVPFPEFKSQDHHLKKLPENAIALKMKKEKPFFVHGELFLTVENDYLLAFKECGKIIWGERLTENNYWLEQVGNRIACFNRIERTFSMISMDTGKTDETWNLPERFWESPMAFHITEEGVRYVFLSDKTHWELYRSSNETTIAQQKSSADFSEFRPLSTHCGRLDVRNGVFYLFGPEGDPKVYNQCFDAYAKGDQLFLLQYDEDKKEDFLSVRTLKGDSEVVSEVQKTISLKGIANPRCIKKLCKNGELILFEGSGLLYGVVFVNLITQEVVHYPKTVFIDKNYLIDEETGTIWINNPDFREMKKITSKGIEVLGPPLSPGRLLHVDKEGRLVVGF